MSDDNMSLSPEMAADAIEKMGDYINLFDYHVFGQNNQATVIVDEPEVFFQDHFSEYDGIGFGRNPNLTGAKRNLYWISPKRFTATLKRAMDMSSHFIGGKVVSPGYSFDEHIVALAIHEVRHRCHHETPGLIPLNPERLWMFPRLRPRWDFLRRSYQVEELMWVGRPIPTLSLNEFDALMIEELMLQILHANTDPEEKLHLHFFPQIAPLISARNPEELAAKLEELGL